MDCIKYLQDIKDIGLNVLDVGQDQRQLPNYFCDSWV